MRTVSAMLTWVWVVLAIALVVLVTAALRMARAHDSWINRDDLRDPISGVQCCGPADCEDLSIEGIKVTEEPNGDVTIADTGERVEARRVIWASPEGHWYRCSFFYGESGATMWKRVRCLIGPPPAT